MKINAKIFSIVFEVFSIFKDILKHPNYFYGGIIAV